MDPYLEYKQSDVDSSRSQLVACVRIIAVHEPEVRGC